MGALAEGPHKATVERIALEAGGAKLDAIHARPDATASAGLVVAPDINGVRLLFDDLCRRLATHGFAVCAVEPFARIPAEERVSLDVPGRMERVKELRDEVQLGDLTAAADYLARTDGVREAVLLGFCMGGYYVLKAGASGRFARAVSCYGMIRTPEQWQGPGHRPPLETAAEVCPTLGVYGDRDPWVPVADVEALREVWAGRTDCRVVVYPGAEHGFVHDPDRPAHRADYAENVWRNAIPFLRGEGSHGR